MRVRSLILAVATLATASAAHAQAKPGRLVIIGGGLSRDNQAVYDAILQSRQGTGPFCVFPTAAANAAEGYASAVTNFDRYGGSGTAVPVVVDVQKPETARDPAIVEQIRKCSGFFFVGGVQSRITNAMLPNGERTPALDALLQRYREGAVISGSSAGAAIMSDPMIAGGTSAGAVASGVRKVSSGNAEDEDSDRGVSIERGLGLFTHALVDQHFLARGRIGRLIVAVDELPEFDLGFGIDENTALVTEGTQVWPVGASGVIVLDLKNAQKNGKSVNHVRLHLMSTGDRYDVNTRALTIDAKKTSLPAAADAPKTPEDPFARWEMLQLLNAFARSPQREITLPFEGGAVVLQKTNDFAAKSGNGTGVQNTPAALSITGITLQLRRDR
jgi:cyanophycinase